MGQRPARIEPLEAQVMKILKARYLELGWNAERLATASGLAKTTAFNSINGKRATTMSELEALAKALGLTPWRVMRQAEDALEETESTSRDVVEVDPLSDLLPQEIYGLTPPDPDDYGVYAQLGDVEAEQEASQELP